ncbi:hypothetical protein GTA08_BOTSDO02560 [Neofusicoccum parvum]|nr:hypothetical protein GTA08_BOTSDO02560 [Neofusicoccum parvum]
MLSSSILRPFLAAILLWRWSAPLPLLRRPPSLPSAPFVFAFLGALALGLLILQFLVPVAVAGCRTVKAVLDEDANAHLLPPGLPLELSPLPIRRYAYVLASPTTVLPPAPKVRSSWPPGVPRGKVCHYRVRIPPPSPWKPGRGILKRPRPAGAVPRRAKSVVWNEEVRIAMVDKWIPQGLHYWGARYAACIEELQTRPPTLRPLPPMDGEGDVEMLE